MPTTPEEYEKHRNSPHSKLCNCVDCVKLNEKPPTQDICFDRTGGTLSYRYSYAGVQLPRIAIDYILQLKDEIKELKNQLKSNDT